MSTPPIYFASSLPPAFVLVGLLAIALVVVVGVCSLINLVARRALLNGWLWGVPCVYQQDLEAARL